MKERESESDVMGQKDRILVVAPTSTIAKYFIDYSDSRFDIVTAGRRNSDIYVDVLADEHIVFPSDVKSIVYFPGVFEDNSPTELDSMIGVNITGIAKVITAAKKSGIRHIIYISSVFSELSLDSHYYNSYAITKKHGEIIAQLLAGNEIKLCVIRPGQVFGPSVDYERHQPLLYMMIRKALNNEDIIIFGSNDATRNYVYADNVFNIINAVVDRKIEGVIKAISPRNLKLSEIAGTIVKEARSNSKIVFLKDKPNINNLAFFNKIDFYSEWMLPYISFEDGIRNVINSLNVSVK